MKLYIAIYDLVNQPRVKMWVEAESEKEAQTIIGNKIKEWLDQGDGVYIGNLKIYKVGEQL